MAPRKPQFPEGILSQQTLNTLFEKMGEAVAVSREAKHIAAGTSQKVDSVSGKIDAVAGQVNALALVVATQGQLRDHVERIEAEIKEHQEEITELMTDKHRREGAMGLVEWLSRNWPLTIILAILGAFVAWANGVKL